jgi:hypothetical protein
LTLDLEQDYGDILNVPRYEGFSQVDRLTDLLGKKNLPLTCFVQGSLFNSHPMVIRQLNSLKTEFGLHSYSHPRPVNMNHEYEISEGRKTYIKYFKKEPLAYRSPSGVICNDMFDVLSKYSFVIDSSIFPSLRPGGYFNSLDKPVKPYLLKNKVTVEFPISVFSKIIRVPITLSYIKLLDKPYFSALKLSKLPNLINFDFHLHDLANLTTYKEIPFSYYSSIYQAIFRKIYRNKNERHGFKLLENVINMFSMKKYEFLTLMDVYNLLLGKT